MSAFQVSARHIAVMVDAALSTASKYHGDAVTQDGRDRLLKMLAEANVASLGARYGAKSAGMPVFDFPAYDWHAVRNNGVLKILKAIACFEYQSCEHDGWKDSEAQRFCHQLRHTMIGELPGYEAAEGWGIE